MFHVVFSCRRYIIFHIVSENLINLLIKTLAKVQSIVQIIIGCDKSTLSTYYYNHRNCLLSCIKWEYIARDTFVFMDAVCIIKRSLVSCITHIHEQKHSLQTKCSHLSKHDESPAKRTSKVSVTFM